MTQLPPDNEPAQPSPPPPPPPGHTPPPPQYPAPQNFQQGYPQPGYSPAPQIPSSAPPTNVLAIIGFIGVFVISLAGIILGHLALSKIKRSGEGGRGLALAAVIIGYVRLLLELLAIGFFIAFVGVFGSIFASEMYQNTENFETDPGYDDPYADSSNDPFDESADDPFSDGLNASSDMPWYGTEKEAFCTALADWELALDEEQQYYEKLLPVTDDPDFKKLVQQQLDSVDVDFSTMNDQEFDDLLEQLEVWNTERSEQMERCIDG